VRRCLGPRCRSGSTRGGRLAGRCQGGLDNDQHVRTRAGEVVVDREQPGFRITITDEEEK